MVRRARGVKMETGCVPDAGGSAFPPGGPRQSFTARGLAGDANSFANAAAVRLECVITPATQGRPHHLSRLPLITSRNAVAPR
jgi:hypothetical protein